MAAQQVVLEAKIRDKSGTGAARADRRAGYIPGVLYGGEAAPVGVALDPKALMRELNHVGFFNKLIQLKVSDKTERVIARAVQFDPVTDLPIHIDLMRVSRGKKIQVSIPVVFVDEAKSPGLKRGGVLNVVSHELELLCDVDHIPEQITVSLEGRDINHSIHIEDLQLPAGAKPVLHGTESTIATILSPTVEAETTSTEAAATAEAATTTASS